jgi:hypothetical protein
MCVNRGSGPAGEPGAITKRPGLADRGAQRQTLWLMLPDSEALQQLRAAGIQAEGVVDATGLVGTAGPGLDRAVRPF